MTRATIALWAWIPISLILFTRFTPRRAVLVSMFTGWLFLPQADFPLPGLPDLTRTVSVTIGAFLGVLLFDSGALSRFRFGIYDLPILAWCLVPLPTSVANGLGVYDGVAGIVEHMLSWGLPYVLGRIYFSSMEGIRDLAVAVVISGLVYAPFVLFEARMSPKLHRIIYGYDPSKFHMAARWGGYRPWVFLGHGIAMGQLMASTTIAAIWLTASGALRHVTKIPAKWAAFGLLVVTAISRAANGWFAVLVGVSTLVFGRVTQVRVLVLALALVPVFYVATRVVADWHAKEVVEFIRDVNPKRATSLHSRLRAEVVLIDHAWKRPILGWGSYERNRPNLEEYWVDSDFGDRTITDSYWIIAFGQLGFAGLIALGLIFLLPLIACTLHLRLGEWTDPRCAPAVCLAVIAWCFAWDCLVNAFPSPLYVLCSGAVLGFPAVWKLARERQGDDEGSGDLDVPVVRETQREAPATSAYRGTETSRPNDSEPRRPYLC